MKKTWVKIIITSAVIVIAGICYILFVTGEEEASVQFRTEEQQKPEETVAYAAIEVSETPQIVLYIHVCGAVKNPGVYEMVQGARVVDALTAAGGVLSGAAEDYVNQARTVVDGERIYLPLREELSRLSSEQYAAGQEKEASGTRLVNINTASMEELTTLPGIGESRAESILSYREKNGAFSTIEEIMNISGIKDAAYERIKDRICTGNE